MSNGKTPRKFSGEFKFRIVMESLKNESTQTEIARHYQLDPNLLNLWRKFFFAHGPRVFEQGRKDEATQKIGDLEKIIGKQTVEINLLKNFLGHYQSR